MSFASTPLPPLSPADPQRHRRDVGTQTDQAVSSPAPLTVTNPSSPPLKVPQAPPGTLTLQLDTRPQQQQMGPSTASRSLDMDDMDDTARFIAQIEAESREWWDLNRATVERYLPPEDGGPSMADIELKQTMDEVAAELAEYKKEEDAYKRMILYMPEEDRKYYPYTADMEINKDYIPRGCFGCCSPSASDRDDDMCEDPADRVDRNAQDAGEGQPVAQVAHDPRGGSRAERSA